jgi:PAS domain-containing protein
MDKNTDLYRQIFSSHPHPTILFGLMDGLIEDVNDAALTLYGYDRREMVGLPFSALSAQSEARLHKRKDGSMLTIEAQRSTVNIGGREVGVAVIREISIASSLALEPVDSESRFRLLADGVAQDLSGLLTSILSLTEMAIRGLPMGDPSRLDLEEVRRLSLRAAKLSLPLKA